MKFQVQLLKSMGKTCAGSVITVSRRDARVLIALNKAILFEETVVADPAPPAIVVKEPEPPAPAPEAPRPAARRSTRISAAPIIAVDLTPEPDASVQVSDTGADSAASE